MKKICFSFNHLTPSNGVARAAIGIANYLSKKDDIEVTLRPIFQFNSKVKYLVNDNINIKPLFSFYAKGLSSILGLIPDSLLHDIIFGKNFYDIEVGFQHGIATKAVVSGIHSEAKHFVWIHGYDEGLSLKKWLQKADKIVCVSQCNMQKLKCILPNNIDYCYNPIDDYFILDQGKEDIDTKKTEELLFVTVGRLSKEKGYSRLIKVTAKLLKEGYHFNVWIIGNGPEYDTLRSLIDELEVNVSIKLLGEQINPHKFTAKADLFICSSFSEGYSTACTEAIILGIPVITTDVSGAEEIIRDAECGMLVGREDADIYMGLKKILDNKSIILEWKKQLKKTKFNFSYSVRTKKIDQILEL